MGCSPLEWERPHTWHAAIVTKWNNTMTHDQNSSDIGRRIVAGIGAGLAGTAVMFAMRKFDSQYASQTLLHGKEDPGKFVVRHAERIGGVALPDQAERAAAVATHIAYGTMYGVVFGLAKMLPPAKSSHPFVFGGLLGAIVWAIGYVGLLPGVGLAKPVTDETFPEVAGELTRHVAYGVATAAVYGVLHDAL